MNSHVTVTATEPSCCGGKHQRPPQCDVYCCTARSLLKFYNYMLKCYCNHPGVVYIVYKSDINHFIKVISKYFIDY